DHDFDSVTLKTLSLNSIKNTYNYAVTLLGQSTSRDTILRAAALFGDAEAEAGTTFPSVALSARHGRGVALYRAGMPDSARAIYNGLLETGYFDTLQLRPSLEELLGLGGACYRTDTLGAVPLLRRRVTTAELETLVANPATASDDALIAMLPPATALTMLGTTNDGWQKVRLSGKSGYIPGYYAGRKTLSPCPPPTVKVDVAAVIAGIKRDMVQVQGGTFTMGCLDGRDGDCDSDEKPAHQVTLSDYAIGKTEVTVAQFRAFIQETGYKTDADKEGSSYVWTGSDWIDKKGVNWKCDVKGRLRPEKDYNHPVIHVSWNDASAYCAWLSGRTGIAYRLPAEAEWEFAARGGNAGKGFLYAGSNELDEVAWYRDNSGQKTHPVARKKPNELGLYDMSGNVWEWCGDWYGDYPSEAKENPQGAEEGVRRVFRGGS
ncbi:MAG: SUMF1/EgtB/PvdO family nonheme iron enzyme, partial [Bacteroidota bacterium]